MTQPGQKVRKLSLRWLWWVVLAIMVLLTALYGGASWYLANQVTLAERKALEASPADFGLAFQDVEFPSRRGDVQLKGWYVPARDTAQDTVIMVHGINSNRADVTIGLVEIAGDLSQRGFNVLMIDLRGHGESGGTQVSGGYYEREDVLGAFDFLLVRGVPSERIGLLGYSLGAAVSLLAAVEEPRIHAVVADSPFADISDLIVGETRKRTDAPAWMVPSLVPGMEVAARAFYGIDMGALVPVKVVPKLDYPVLLVHGTADQRILPSHSVQLKAASRNPDTQLWLVDGVEHVKAYRSAPKEYIDRVAGYFQKRLG